MLRASDLAVVFSVAYGAEMITYQPLAGGAPLLIPALLSIPQRTPRTADQTGEVTQPYAEIRKSDVAKPARGDTIKRASGQVYTARAVDLDAESVIWRLELAAQ